MLPLVFLPSIPTDVNPYMNTHGYSFSTSYKSACFFHYTDCLLIHKKVMGDIFIKSLASAQPLYNRLLWLHHKKWVQDRRLIFQQSLTSKPRPVQHASFPLHAGTIPRSTSSIASTIRSAMLIHLLSKNNKSQNYNSVSPMSSVCTVPGDFPKITDNSPAFSLHLQT